MYSHVYALQEAILLRQQSTQFQLFLLCLFLSCPPFRAVYTGLAPGHSQDIGICIALIGMGLGFSVQFVLSERISAESNLYILLTVSVAAVYLFVIADHHFGSGRKRRGNCCERKRVEKTVNGQPEELAASDGMSTLHSLYHTIH